MTVEQIIRFLRLSVSIQDAENGNIVTEDSEYLAMSDEDLLLYLNIVLTRNFPDIPSIAFISNEEIYPIVTLTKKELYSTLAAKDAPLYDLGADNNNYLKRSQRFEHYMKLVAQADKEYSDWLENGGSDNGVVKSYKVTLSDRYSTRYNFENSAVPKVSVYVGAVSDTAVEFWWKVKDLSRFYRYKVFISENPIVDMFNLSDHIDDKATLIAEIKDIHQTRCRVQSLEPEKTYYLAVQVIDMTTLSGYAQTQFTTQPLVEGDENGG